MEATNINTEVPNDLLHILSQRPTKKQTGKRQHGPREGSLEETSDEREADALSSTSTTTATTTTTTTTTEAPQLHPKAPLPNPIETHYTVDGEKETTRTIVDFFPDLPFAVREGEAEVANTHMDTEQQTAPENTQEAAGGDSGRRKRRKKKKKNKEPTAIKEEPAMEYLDEGIQPQDYPNYMYPTENSKDSSTEAEGVEDLFPDGLPEGYPTDRFRADGNYSQNTR